MWGREMRAGLAFVLASLLVGSAFREWKRAHESRFEEIVAGLESRDAAARKAAADSGATDGLDAQSGEGRRDARSAPRAPALAPSRIDLDRADAKELERLPGIGPALARRIVVDRAARGPFRAPQALLRVKGIGPRTLERIRPYLSAPAGPVGAADSASPIAN
jgi:competence ComEA-like helix-hairpin-helix protein